jgi:hypothetical protein
MFRIKRAPSLCGKSTRPTLPANNASPTIATPNSAQYSARPPGE